MNLIKAVIILLIVSAALGAFGLWYQTFLVGAYYASAGITLTILMGAAPVGILAIAYYAVRATFKFQPSDLS